MRIFHKLYAHLFGYFWLPCPVCGRMFGGHEAAFGVVLKTSEYGCGKLICSDPQCASRAQYLNQCFEPETDAPELDAINDTSW